MQNTQVIDFILLYGLQMTRLFIFCIILTSVIIIIVIIIIIFVKILLSYFDYCHILVVMILQKSQFSDL